jgi:hypothetical protein
MAVEYIDVYWGSGKIEQEDDSIFYAEPKTVLSSLVTKKNKNNKTGNYLQCPSVYNLLGNTLVVRSPIDTGVEIPHRQDEISRNIKTYGLEWNMIHEPSVIGHPLIILGLPYLFFCEEEVTVMISSPYFEKSPHLNQGNIVPGTMNIGSWFRPLNMEFNLHEGQYNLDLKEDEAIAYITFITDKKIKLNKFRTSDDLIRISNSLVNTTRWEPRVPLAKRYKRFREAQMKKIVLNEIKKNII